MSSPPAGLTSPQIGSIALDSLIGRGKEGATYRIATKPHLVAKIYHSLPSPKTIKKLEIMISNPPMPHGNGAKRPLLAWPQALVHDNNQAVCGFVMPVVEPTWSINSLFFPEHRVKLRTSTNAQIGWHHLHEIARNLALTVGACHHSGYVVGDLNNNNVRVYADGQVCLIDTDSFQVLDVSQRPPAVHHCEVVFLDYAAPELIGQDLTQFDRTPASDYYSLATLIFMLLQDGLHPFAAVTTTDPPLDPSQLMQSRSFPYASTRKDQSVTPYPMAPSFGRLHPQLRDLFIRTFTVGLDAPSRRPSADLWQESLAVARADLRKCARDHYFVAGPDAVCLQIVSVSGGGYCGSTEQTRSAVPLPFQTIDPYSGNSLIPGSIPPQQASTAQHSPPSPPQAPPSPPPPAPPPPNSNRTPHGRALKTAMWALGIVAILAFVVSQRPPSEPSTVAPSYRSPTQIIRQPTTVPAIPPTHIPTPVATKVPSNAPPTVSASTSTSIAVEAPVVTLSEILTEAREAGALFYSARIDHRWDLYIEIPDSGRQVAILQGSSVDPAPALSHDGGQLAYLVRTHAGYAVQILNLKNGAMKLIPWSNRNGSPSNLAWQASDTALLVTTQTGNELRILELNPSSDETGGFLPPWSANPSVRADGTMVYVVPAENDRDNLGIVIADSAGNARKFLTQESSNENYPSVNSVAPLLAYTITNSDARVYSLGLVGWTDDETPTNIPVPTTLSSSAPIRTYWIDEASLVVGFCEEATCEIITYSLDGGMEPILEVPGVNAFGNIILRSR